MMFSDVLEATCKCMIHLLQRTTLNFRDTLCHVSAEMSFCLGLKGFLNATVQNPHHDASSFKPPL